MKTLFVTLALAMCLSSCVFESPFEATAKAPVEQALLGRWQEVPANTQSPGNRMLVLQHSENEYLVRYPEGDKAMFFRAFAVDLAGQPCIQIQLIGTAEGAVKPENRKFHLLKVEHNGDALELKTINRDVLGKDLKQTDELKAAFAARASDPSLFAEPMKFRRAGEP